MQKKLLVIAAMLITIVLLQYACNQAGTDDKTKPGTDEGVVNTSSNAPFPDFGFMIPPEEAEKQGIRVFRLRQNYPETLPTPAAPDFFIYRF